MLRDFFQNTRRPEGLGGKLMVAMMNHGHAKLAQWGLARLTLLPNARVLDCGCGGGANLAVLLAHCPQGEATGLDYSAVSVAASRRKNAAAIAAGRCRVVQGEVSELPFGEDEFDAVTAFETVYFWSDIEGAFREIYRTMHAGGTFLICNEADGEDAAGAKWTEVIPGMIVYTSEQLSLYLGPAERKNATLKPLKILNNRNFCSIMNASELWQRRQKCLRVGLGCTDTRTVNN